MRRVLFSLLWIGTTALADTDAVTTGHRLLYLGGEEALSGGGYVFGDGQKVGVLFLPFSYELSPDGITSFYLSACPGYGTAQYNAAPWMKLYGLKLGGGLRYSIGVDSTLHIGGAYQLASFDPASSLSGSGYDVTAEYSCHPQYGGWNPYLATRLRYISTSITRAGATDTTHTFTAKSQIGLVTPALAYPFGLPLHLEIYGGGIYLQGDLARILQTHSFAYTGVTAYLKSPILSDYISDITFNLQVVRGEDLKGLNLGIGIRF